MAEWSTPAGGGSGNVTGAASSTDNAIVRFDGTGGKTIQNSGCTVDDSDNLTAPGNVITSGGRFRHSSGATIVDSLASQDVKFMPGNDASKQIKLNESGLCEITGLDVKLITAGRGIYLKEGTNATMGSDVLVGGTVTISTTKVTASSRIFLTSQADDGTVGFLRVSSRTAGTSFVITSSSGTDTSTVAWMIIEPA